jgi:hypothetical protein
MEPQPAPPKADISLMESVENLVVIRDALVCFLNALSDVKKAEDEYHEALKDAGWSPPSKGETPPSVAN